MTERQLEIGIEWANKRSELKGSPLTEIQLRYLKFILSGFLVNKEPPILSFKGSKGEVIHDDYVEPRIKEGIVRFYEVDCTNEVQEVFPQY